MIPLDSIGALVGFRCTALPHSPLSIGGLLHSGALPTPVPHWVVLLAVVPALWVVIGAGVLTVDRLLQRLDT